MTDRVCAIEGCRNPYFARGWCNTHYQQWRRKGDPLHRERNPFPQNLLTRMEPQPNGCILFTGSVNSDGYGTLWMDGRVIGAHRAAYELLVGPIPDGMTLDHECHNEDLTCHFGSACPHRRCVNVEHLAPKTIGDNCRSSLAGQRIRAA